MRTFRAKSDDVPRMMQCARLCCTEHGLDKTGGALNEAHYESCWRNLINNDIGVMFLVEDGDPPEVVAGIGGARYPALLTGLDRCSQIFLYVRPDYRGRVAIRRLMVDLEVWALETGCSDILMPLLASMPTSARNVYDRMGYFQMESVFKKSLVPKTSPERSALCLSTS